MSSNQGGGKLPGKTEYAGRRRAMTRTSGFTVHEDTSGGEFKRRAAKIYTLNAGEMVEVTFTLSSHAKGDLLGYGLWFWHTPGVKWSLTRGPESRTLTQFDDGSWNKLGSIWEAENSDPLQVIFRLIADVRAEVALYEPLCGRLRHKHLDNARRALLPNMYEFAPEALFIDSEIDAVVDIKAPENAPIGHHPIIIKSCNRCGRYLPINFPNERNHLSFTNHCVAAHRRPCKHHTFGRLRNAENTADILKLDYGFQLECRFCKKFEVNAAHNPQRTSAQMKEDGARRRAFEFLLEQLYGGFSQLRYRLEHNSELANDIWERFGRACFNCNTELATAKKMHLDHTRPLALLWPLDGSATALCKDCNTSKRDRPPSEFYTQEKLEELAAITGIPLSELRCVKPNEDAINLLLSRMNWLFDVFLTRAEMVKERDGKIVGELVVKALQKVLSNSHLHRNVDLQGEYERRRQQKK